MQNYPEHQHHMFSNYQLPHALSQPPLPPTNRFVHINHHHPPSASSQRVFVNPHFKTAHKAPGPGAIYVNPLMYARPGPSKQIHINPNIHNVHIHINPNFASSKTPPPVVEKPKSLVVLTKTKLVRRSSDGGTRKIKRRNSVKSPYKIIRCNPPKKKCTPVKKPVTPYNAKSRFKIDRRLKKSPGSVSKKVYRNVVKMVKKQSSNHLSVVNISGVLYKKSRNTLRKTSAMSPRAKLPKPHHNKVIKSQLKVHDPNKTILKKFKLVRSKINRDSRRKLKKCNIPCPTYRKYGLCKGKDNGKCLWKHDPAQIALCTRFLQGACIKEKCPLSHNVSAEKMPTCKYYLEGTCSKENCPYLHVKISSKAEVCRDFLEGYCSKAIECDKRHQYLCPDYEKYGACQKQRCPYPHGKMVRRYTINKQKFVKKCSEPNNVETLTDSEKLRYYCDSKEEGTDTGPCLKNYVGLQSRPKLGSLPNFIAFGDT